MADVNASAPAPKLDRRGRIIIGPTLLARWTPAATIGLPIIALITAGVVSTFLPDVWFAAVTGWPRLAVRVLAGWLVGWAVTSAAGLLLLALTHESARLDQDAGTVLHRSALKRWRCVTLADIVAVHPDARKQGATAIVTPGTTLYVPHTGWDDAGFDGVRALQAELQPRLDVTPAPPRAQCMRQILLADALRTRRTIARALTMPWRDEYADRDTFERALDDARRGSRDG